MKKLLIIASLMAVGFMASASELYWMVDQADAGSVAPAWDYAVLYGATQEKNTGGTAISAIGKEDVALAPDSVSASALTSYTSFYVELCNSSDVRLAATDLISYGTLSESIYSGGMSTPTAYSFTGFTTEVVPEPTSGLLVLFGMMALGLKRKRV